jgi:hypothetical protein
VDASGDRSGAKAAFARRGEGEVPQRESTASMMISASPPSQFQSGLSMTGPRADPFMETVDRWTRAGDGP